jgi:tetratricopeptide (TPR) repeat protein
MKQQHQFHGRRVMVVLRGALLACLSWLGSVVAVNLPLQAGAQSPSAVEEHVRRGQALLSQGHWDGAIKELKTAVRLDANRADAHAHLAMAYYFKGDAAAAIPEFRAALQADPARVDAAYGLGLTLSETGDLSGAVAAFRSSARLNPAAHYNLGNALEQQGDTAGALEAYKSYLATAPQTLESLALQTAVSKGVNPTPAAGTAKEHFHRGQALLNNKDAMGAVTEFLTALRLKPNYVEACNGLGLAFRLKGELDEAIAGYQMALRLDANFAAAHRHLAQAFEEKGDRLLAAQAYDRYLLLVPGAADAAEVRTKIARLRSGTQ